MTNHENVNGKTYGDGKCQKQKQRNDNWQRKKVNILQKKRNKKIEEV